MKHKYGRLMEFANLHSKAEVQLSTSLAQSTTQEPQDNLLYELRVHQIELEMQNEELRRTQVALEQALERYVNLYELAPVGYVTLSENGTINEANLTSADSFGENRASLLKQHFQRYIDPEDCLRWHQYFQQVLHHGKSKGCEMKMRRADNTIFYAHLDCIALEPHKIPYSNAGMLAARVAITDITDLKLAEQDLRIAATVFESQECMIVTDAQQVILRVNQAFTKLTGYHLHEVVGLKPNKLSSGHHSNEFYAEIWSSINSTNTWQGEVWERKKNGEIFPCLLTITAIKNEEGDITHYVATLIDISVRKVAEEEMLQLAFYDSLTRLPNRRLMLDRIHQAIRTSSRTRRHCALMFIDLDNFKAMNDSLGHDIGDMLLQLVAQRLSICIREGDTVARMGGDEFMVMLENLSDNLQEAERLAKTIGKKILFAVSQAFCLGGHECFSSASIGVTLFINHRYTIPELQKQADIAMYQAKMDGRNVLRFFKPEMLARLDVKH